MVFRLDARATANGYRLPHIFDLQINRANRTVRIN